MRHASYGKCPRGSIGRRRTAAPCRTSRHWHLPRPPSHIRALIQVPHAFDQDSLQICRITQQCWFGPSGAESTINHQPFGVKARIAILRVAAHPPRERIAVMRPPSYREQGTQTGHSVIRFAPPIHVEHMGTARRSLTPLQPLPPSPHWPCPARRRLLGSQSHCGPRNRICEAAGLGPVEASARPLVRGTARPEGARSRGSRSATKDRRSKPITTRREQAGDHPPSGDFSFHWPVAGRGSA